MDDGTPPPESVVIERVCQGYVRPEGHTDSKGHFSFQLGANNAMVADASMSTYDPLNPSGSIPGTQNRGVDQRALMGCEIRASLPGFRSDVVNLMNRRSMDNPDVGVIVLHRLGDVEGLTISVTSSLAPKDAKKAYDKGKEALAKNKPEEPKATFQGRGALSEVRHCLVRTRAGAHGSTKARRRAHRFPARARCGREICQPLREPCSDGCVREQMEGCCRYHRPCFATKPRRFPAIVLLQRGRQPQPAESGCGREECQ